MADPVSPPSSSGTPPTPPEGRGTLTIADKVVERIATIAAGEITKPAADRPGWERALRRNLPKATAKVATGQTRVAVDVAAVWPSSLSEIAGDVRDHVNERVATLTGITVTAVDVSVADIVHSDTSTRRVQ